MDTRAPATPPRHLAVAWRRRSRAATATPADPMAAFHAAKDTYAAAVRRRHRAGDDQRVRTATALLLQMAADLDREQP